MKGHLILLVAGVLLPVVLFSTVIVQRLSQQERAATERRTLQAAYILAETVDREVSGTARTLQALAESDELDQGDLQTFYREAQRAAKTQSTWLAVLLLKPDGRQVLNTAQPLGTALPPIDASTTLAQVIETRLPTTGDLSRGEQGRLTFPVQVPVVRDGQLQYVLAASITPQALTSVMREQFPVDGEWTRTVVDSQGYVVARTRNPERFIGQQGTASFLQHIQAHPEGVYRDTTLEGVKVYVAHRRLANSRWTAAVTVPVTVVEGPARQAMGLVIGTGLGLLLVSGCGAFILSWRISEAIASTAEAAEALAKGEQPLLQPSSIQEVALLRAALAHSASLLRQRERERDENLARAEIARAEAEATSHLKDEFLITASHELKTPLNAILGWTTLLRGGNLDENRTRRAIETIERNARAQARLVEDLLDTSRIITGKLRLESQLVNMDTVLLNALDSVRHSAEAKQVELVVQVLSKTDPVLGDPNRLQQVMWNLLSNAIKFTPTGGQVGVTLSQADAWVEAAVRDTGIGIRAEFLPYVFERFRQADGSTTRNFGGLGLGLAIVRHLVELQGGTVQASSDGADQGATFTVKLPAAMAAQEQSDGLRSQHPETWSSAESALLQGVRVLVVDDEPDARDLVTTVLAQQGADLRACSSAAAAFQMVVTWRPAVILSDIGMAGTDGYSFIQQVRQWEQGTGARIPAAAVTAFARDEDRLKALECGFQALIAKPVEPEELAATVVRLLQGSLGLEGMTGQSKTNPASR